MAELRKYRWDDMPKEQLSASLAAGSSPATG